MTDKIKPDLTPIEWTADELREIMDLLDEAVKAKGIAYAPIALYLHNKIMSVLNLKGDNTKNS